MRRRTFDALMVVAGLALATVLLVAGVLLTWGHNFVSNEVRSQLVAQKIVFPPASSDAIKSLPKADATAMRVFAGQEMTTGAQAQTFADHFIAVHLHATVFKGTTLRGMLLNAYGFWQMGQIALIGAIAAFAGAALMLILSLAGAWHLRRTPETAEVFSRITHPKVQTV
jgi:hypothetical protein